MTNVPSTGAVIKLKLENADASIVHEVDLLSSVSNEWEELVYDFSARLMEGFISRKEFKKVFPFIDFSNSNDSIPV